MAKEKNIQQTFSTGAVINKRIIKNDWKFKVDNFLREATFDTKENVYWVIEKELKKIPRMKWNSVNQKIIIIQK